MGGIDGSQLAPDLVHDDVREARALGRVGSAAEAASAVNIVAGLRHGAIAPDLSQLPPETLVVSAAVEHRDLDGHARGLEDCGRLGHLADSHHASLRPALAVHGLVERRDWRALGARCSRRRPGVVVGQPVLGLARPGRLVHDRVGVEPDRPVGQHGVLLRPAFLDQRGELALRDLGVLERARVRRAEQRAPRRLHVIRDAVEHVIKDGLVEVVSPRPHLAHCLQADVALRLDALAAGGRHRHGRLAFRQRAEIPVPRPRLGRHRLHGHPQVGRPHLACRSPLACRRQPHASAASAIPRAHARQPGGGEQLLYGRDRGRAARLGLGPRQGLRALRLVELGDRPAQQLLLARRLVRLQ